VERVYERCGMPLPEVPLDDIDDYITYDLNARDETRKGDP